MNPDVERQTVPGGFPSRMTRRETVCAAVYLPVHIVVIPLLLGLPAFARLFELGEGAVNAVYYGVGAAFMLIALFGFLRRDFDVFLDRPFKNILNILTGYAVSFALSWGLSLIMLSLGLMLEESPNDEAVMSIAALDYNKIFAASVLLAPLVEEPLFRGLLFGGLRGRGRGMAYAVSMLVFALYHVWQYAVLDPSYLIYIITYLPVSYALCLCYERSGTIWAPIGLHMLNNAISLSVLSML